MSTLNSVNEDTETTTTTVNMISTVNNEEMVIGRHQIECQREFSISSIDIDLTSDGTVKTNQINTNLATFKLLSSLGEMTFL